MTKDYIKKLRELLRRLLTQYPHKAMTLKDHPPMPEELDVDTYGVYICVPLTDTRVWGFGTNEAKELFLKTYKGARDVEET